MEALEQGKGFDLKMAPFETADAKKGINKTASKPASQTFYLLPERARSQ